MTGRLYLVVGITRSRQDDARAAVPAQRGVNAASLSPVSEINEELEAVVAGQSDVPLIARRAGHDRPISGSGARIKGAGAPPAGDHRR
jgi:hypothetical protein